MTSSRPYLLRAFYAWIIDNNLTPYLLLNAEVPFVEVPEKHIEDGKIVLNISPKAVQQMQIDNRYIEFDASFTGSIVHVYAPMQAVMAIYARENGRGMVFNEEDEDGDNEPPLPKRKLGKPKLTVIK